MKDETAADLDQADERILTYDVSDEALEAAGMESLAPASYTPDFPNPTWCCP
jgi:hypothetical protein